MSGTATPNLPLSNGADDVIGNSKGNTVRIALSRLAALLSYLQGPAYKTSAELFADKAWPDGAIGQVYGDTAGQNGTYRKSGAAGTGSWTRTGDLAVSPLTAAQLADKADLSLVNELISEVRTGRVYAPHAATVSAMTPPAGTDWLLTSAGASVQYWVTANAPADGVATDALQADATGQWWRRVFDGRGLTAGIDELRAGRVWATGVGSPSGQTPPPGTYRIQTPAGTGVQEWVRAAAPNPATETDTLKLDATGQWWQRRFDSRDIPALASELYGIGLTSGVMRLPTVGGTADAITADPAAQSANVVIGNNSLLMLTPLLTTTASDPTLTTRGVTRTIRDADGGALRAGDLRAGCAYILRVRSATEVRIVSGGVNQRDLLRLVAALPLIGAAAMPVVQGVPEVGRTLAADYGTPESSAEIDWQVSDTGVGTQGWAVFASGKKVTLAAAQLGKFIRFRYRIGAPGVWVISAVVGPVTELTDQALIEIELLKQTVAQLESAVAALQSQTPGAPAMIAAPLDLYRQSAASPGIGWLGNVTAPLPSTAATMLTTYSPAENVIHPCMVELPKPLLGFKYISAITAYPNGPALEDPFVYGSNDRMNWTFLGSTPQPLDVKPETTGAYNSDTFITHDPATGELIVGYRAYAPRDNTSSAGANSDVIIYIRRTKDGNTWTPREEIFRIQASVNIFLSPTMIYDPVGGLWHMWTIRRPDMHHWTAPSISGPWTQDTATVSGRVSEVVEIVWRRNLRVNQHPPNRRRQPPGRSRHEAEYRQLVLFATARRRRV